MSGSNTYYDPNQAPTGSKRKRATPVVSSNLERTGHRSAPNVPRHLGHPPPYAPDNASPYMDLLREAQTAGGAVSMDFSGSTINAGGKLTRTTIATQKITERVKNSVFKGDKGITELRDAPKIEVTHMDVQSVSSSGSINSQTKAAESATLKMTTTITAAGKNLTITQEATETLEVDETNVRTHVRNNVEINRKAKRIKHVVDGQQVPA